MERLTAASQTTVNRNLKKNHKFMYNLELFILCAPVVIYFFVVNYLPMFGTVLAFKNYSYAKGILGSPWVGLENFKFFFLSQDALRITRNTVCYGVAFLVLGILSQVVMALLIFEIHNKLCIKLYQTFMLLPQFISWVIVGYISYIFLNPSLGLINRLLHMLGAETIDFYAYPKYWPVILTIFHLWKSIGMGSIIYYAALLGIDNSLFEAAKIDGAKKLHLILYISLPSLIPVITILAIMSIGSIFRGDFGLFYQVSRDVGLLYPTTDIIDTYIYRSLRTGDINISAAVGLFQSVVSLVMIVSANKIVGKIEPDNSLF